jgi:hypothetical protein
MAVISDLRHRPTHLFSVGVDAEILQVDEAVCRGGPGLALGLLDVTGLGFPRGK